MIMAKKNVQKFQELQQQLELLQKYSEELDEKLVEYTSTKESLAEMQNVKKGTPLFVPVAPSFFAKVSADSFTELLVSVGANVAVTKTIPQAIQFVENQIKEIEQAKAHLGATMQETAEHANALLEEFNGTV